MLRRLFVSGACCLIFLTVASTEALAQRGIFATPIPNAPFYGMVEVQRSFIRPDGKVKVWKSTQLIARDSTGRIYNEMHELVPVSSTAIPPLLSAHIYDPQTRISTMLFPQRHLYRSGLVNGPPPTEPSNQLDASPAGANLPPNPYTKEIDLGTRQLDGLEVHGVREIQTIPASGTSPAVTLTDEYWYSYYLHMNLVVKHTDSRTGSTTMTITQLSLSNPDPSLFTIPAGYKRIRPRR